MPALQSSQLICPNFSLAGKLAESLFLDLDRVSYLFFPRKIIKYQSEGLASAPSPTVLDWLTVTGVVAPLLRPSWRVTYRADVERRRSERSGLVSVSAFTSSLFPYRRTWKQRIFEAKWWVFDPPSPTVGFGMYPLWVYFKFGRILCRTQSFSRLNVSLIYFGFLIWYVSISSNFLWYNRMSVTWHVSLEPIFQQFQLYILATKLKATDCQNKHMCLT